MTSAILVQHSNCDQALWGLVTLRVCSIVYPQEGKLGVQITSLSWISTVHKSTIYISRYLRSASKTEYQDSSFHSTFSPFSGKGKSRWKWTSVKCGLGTATNWYDQTFAMFSKVGGRGQLGVGAAAPGGTPLCGVYRYVPRDRVCFFFEVLDP